VTFGYGGVVRLISGHRRRASVGESLLVGTEVTFTATAQADGSGIAWGAPVWSGSGVALEGDSAVVTIGRDAEATVTLQNHAATSTAGISLLKGLAGEAAGAVDADAEFPATVTNRFERDLPTLAPRLDRPPGRPYC
jgi:hypothetical protein